MSTVARTSRVAGTVKRGAARARRRSARWARALGRTIGTPLRLLSLGLGLLTLGLRLHALDLAPLSATAARTLAASVDLLTGLGPPLSGPPTILGLQQPPGLSYLLALPMALERDPRLAVGLAALVALAGVLALASLASRLVGGGRSGLVAALVAGLLWAVNPAAIALTRAQAPEAFLAALGSLLLFGLAAGVAERRGWGWALATATLGAMASISLAALLLMPAMALLMLIYRGRVRWRHLLFGAGLALLMATPLLYRENLARFRPVREAWAQVAAGAESRPSVMAVLDAARKAHGGAPEEPDSPSGVAQGGSRRSQGVTLRATWPLSAAVEGSEASAGAGRWPQLGVARDVALEVGGWAVLAAALALWPLALRAWSHWRERRHPAIYLTPAILFWSTLGILLLLPVIPGSRLLAVLQPVGFLAAGLGAAHVVERGRAILPGGHPRFLQRLVRTVAGLLGGLALVALTAPQALGVVEAQRFGTPQSRRLAEALPVRFWLQTAALVRREAAVAQVGPVWVLADLSASLTQEEAEAPLALLLRRRPRPVWLGEGATVLPAGRNALYLRFAAPGDWSGIDDASVPATDPPLPADTQAVGLALSPERGLEARVLRAPAREVSAVLEEIATPADASLAPGLVLLGHTASAPASAGEGLVVDTYWTFVNLPPDVAAARHRLVVALATASGQPVASAEGLGLPADAWQEGHLVRQRHFLALPEELAPGEYRLFAEVEVVDPLGGRVSTSTLLQVLTVD